MRRLDREANRAPDTKGVPDSEQRLKTAGSGGSKFDLVVFDCDGVLVDSEPLSCQTLADALGRHGLPISLDEVYGRFLGRGSADVGAHFRESKGHPLPEAFWRDYRSDLDKRFHDALKPMPHIFEALAALECPYCLASSSDMDRINLTLSVTKLAPYFDGCVYNGAMVARSKPAPDLFLFAAAAMGADPVRTLVVEDSETGVAAGKAAGMTVWGFTGGSHHVGPDGEQRLINAGADRIFASMTELRVP
jgi:HAD superfamily hydrolase (TIGR01509 family)